MNPTPLIVKSHISNFLKTSDNQDAREKLEVPSIEDLDILYDPLLVGYKEKTLDMGTVDDSYPLSFNLLSATIFKAILTENKVTTFLMPSISDTSVSNSFTLFLQQATNPTGSVTFVGVSWGGDSENVTITPLSGTYIYSFTSLQSIWYGSSNSTLFTVNKTSLGLGNVDNTADIDKPISIDTQNALDLKIGSSTETLSVVSGNTLVTPKSGVLIHINGSPYTLALY